jgi:hypothetical protein
VLAAPASQASGEALDLEANLDPNGGSLSGRARFVVRNTSTATLASVPLWLYPNHLAERPAALNDVSFHWMYPRLFSPAAMEIGDVRAEGAPVPYTVEDTDAGAATLARVALARPLRPGEAVTLEVAFETIVPRRFGGFGCDGPRCRLMGGFYPTPAHLGEGGWDLAAAPDRVSARVTVNAPAGLALVVNGVLAPRHGAGPVTVTSANVPYATIVTDRAFYASTFDTRGAAGGFHVEILHRSPRPPDSEDLPLPYVREDIAGLVIEATRRALEVVAEQGLEPPRGHLTLIEAPLRHELVHVHGDVILYSDQLFRIFPLARVRKYHRLELVRAVFTAALDAALGPTEPPEDRELGAGMLACYLLDAFTLRDFKTIEFAKDILRPIDFIPAVDQLMYAPLVASSSTYFGDVDADDPFRDDVRRFATKTPSPRLLYNKLLDVLGPAGMTRVARAVLATGKPLKMAAAEAFGADLGWFWAQWLGPTPRVNYRLAGVAVGPRPDGAPGVHVTIDVAREGADVLEPVEVRVDDRAGGTRTLTWRRRGPRGRLETDLPAGLKSVEVDPQARLVETALGSLRPSDDPLYDNRAPARWRLLYQGFGALLNVSAVTATFEAAFVLKPQHDLRRAILLRAFHDEASTVGVGGWYDWFFGPQADRNSLTSAFEVGLSASRLDPSYGLPVGAPRRPGYDLRVSVGIDHDTRDYIIDPWRAVGLAARAGYGLTLLEDGQRLSQVGASGEVLRLFELLPGHVLGVDASGGAELGSIAVRAQLTDAGGILGLRGYLPGQLLARANVVGRLQLRDDYVTALDWNLLHFATVRGLAGTLFADGAAITTCDGYGFAKDRLFADAGYSFRVLYDAFGVYQQLFSIDLAVPLVSRAPGGRCLGEPEPALPAPKWTLLITFLPNF